MTINIFVQPTNFFQIVQKRLRIKLQLYNIEWHDAQINSFIFNHLLTCDWTLKVDKVFDVDDDAGIDDGDGVVQLISVSTTLSPEMEDIELLLTPDSWLLLFVDAGGINDNGLWCWLYTEDVVPLRLNAASSEK